MFFLLAVGSVRPANKVACPPFFSLSDNIKRRNTARMTSLHKWNNQWASLSLLGELRRQGSEGPDTFLRSWLKHYPGSFDGKTNESCTAPNFVEVGHRLHDLFSVIPISVGLTTVLLKEFVEPCLRGSDPFGPGCVFDFHGMSRPRQHCGQGAAICNEPRLQFLFDAGEVDGLGFHVGFLKRSGN